MNKVKQFTAAATLVTAAAAASPALAVCEWNFQTANDTAHAASHWSEKNTRMVGRFNFGSAERDCERAGDRSANSLIRHGRPLPEGTTLDIECRGTETTLGVIGPDNRLQLFTTSAPSCR